MANKVKVALIGGTGYGGAEILRRLLFHPGVEVVRVTAADNIGKKVSDVHFNMVGVTDLVFEELPAREAAKGADVVFMALPHKTTAKVAMELFDTGVKIVDMSGDFRLENVDEYRKFYAEHPCPERLGTYVYGMPELFRDQLRTAKYVAAPGCFATTITLGLLPLAKAGLLTGPIRTVAATGSSGSGAAPQLGTHHPLRANNMRTYKPLSHQHVPEILQTLRKAGGKGMALEFVPVSAPMPRGIFATSFIDVPEHVTKDVVGEAFKKAYAGEPFVRIIKGERQPEVIAVYGSNYAEVGFTVSEPSNGRRSVVCFSAIDNLVKGGAGQAVQAFNVMCGFEETESLRQPGQWP